MRPSANLTTYTILSPFNLHVEPAPHLVDLETFMALGVRFDLEDSHGSRHALCFLSALTTYIGLTVLAFYNLTDCTYTWSRHDNTNVDGGVQVTTASTLDACQAACINNASCTGVDWTNTNECWMSGSWSGQRNDGTSPDVTHYDLTRNCDGQTLASTIIITYFRCYNFFLTPLSAKT